MDIKNLFRNKKKKEREEENDLTPKEIYEKNTQQVNSHSTLKRLRDEAVKTGCVIKPIKIIENVKTIKIYAKLESGIVVLSENLRIFQNDDYIGTICIFDLKRADNNEDKLKISAPEDILIETWMPSFKFKAYNTYMFPAR